MTAFPTTVQAIHRPSVSGHRPGEPTLTPNDIMVMIRRRIVSVIVLSIFFTGLSMGGFLVWWFLFPGYKSESLIECISNVAETNLAAEQQRLQQEEHERFVMTQALLIRSPVVLSEVLKISEVRDTEWFKSRKEEDLLDDLEDELGAAPARGTNFLRVAMECRKRDDATAIVKNIVNEWYRQVKAKSAESFAAGQLEATSKELEDHESKIESKRQRLRQIINNLPAGAHMNPDNTLLADEARQINTAVQELQLELSQLDQYRTIYNSEARVVTAEDRQIVEQDPEVAELMRARLLLEQNRAASDSQFGANHAEMKNLDRTIDALEDKLTTLQNRKFLERRSDLKQAVETAYLSTQRALYLAQERLVKTERALADQGKDLTEFKAVDDDIKADVEYREKLREKVSGLRRVKDQQTAVQVSIAQAATRPIKRNSPNPFIMIPFGILLSMALGIGIPLTFELLDKSIRTSQDISRHLDVPLLGAIPDTDDEEVSIDKVETAVRDTPRSMISEAFRRVRTSLQFSAPAENQRTVLVASANPEDGRTTVATNLAIAVAQGGRRVLLVDANFRRPSLQEVFSGVKSQGLSNVLVGNAILADCTSSTDVTRLDVIGSGPIPPNPAELLGSEPCRTFLREVASKYDQVIIDSAPLLLASDSVVLSTAVDGCVLVVRARENSRGAAKRAVNMLHGVGAHLFGAVLNAAQTTRGGYFKEQLRSFYDYQLEDSTK